MSDNFFDNVSFENGPIPCEKCSVTFNMRTNFIKHIRTYHPEVRVRPPKLSQICAICSERFRKVSQLHGHLESQHDIHLNFVHKTFYVHSDFLAWKDTVEIEDKATFVVKNTCEIAEGETKTYYACHRSGSFNPKMNRSRQFKLSGSVKLGFTCPAFMSVTCLTVDDISEIKVEYQSVHVGHDCEINKNRLPRRVKEHLASFLQIGVPFERILFEANKVYSPRGLRLIRRRDLHNICRDFNIKKNVHLQKEDELIVDVLVKKMQNEMYNPVLVYKPNGSILPDYPSIGSGELLLGIMTEVQANLLEVYGTKCVMIDSTHGTHKDSFQLITILVDDGNENALPVATLLTSRISIDTLTPFFMSIKQRLPNFKTNIIMSDDYSLFPEAWQATFNDESKHLLCIWQVNKNWNSNINAKVKHEMFRENIKSDLKNLSAEPEVPNFLRYMQHFIEIYEGMEYNFMKYFKNKYAERSEKWAYCYRVNLDINPEMKLERWHRSLKYNKTGETAVKRLDKTVGVVMSGVAKRLLSRVVLLENDELTTRIELIQSRHNQCMKMVQNYNLIEWENKYVITKIKDSSMFTYNVERLDEKCECLIKCELCSICIHCYSCTCIDYCMRFIICKHIHYVCQRSDLLSVAIPHESADDISAMSVDVDSMETFPEETKTVKDETENRIIILTVQNEDPAELENMKQTAFEKNGQAENQTTRARFYRAT